MAPGFDEGRRMTRSARRAHPEPTPEPSEPQESRSESEEPLDIEQERNANIEARIQRLQTVIQSRKDHLRDIFVLYNHRANPATYCTPEDFMDTSPDRSTADPPHMSPLLASLGEWSSETPPVTPPMVDELPASVLEEDKLDLERLQELVPKPVQATPPPVVVPVPVVVDDVEVASSYSDAQDMDIDSSSPRPAPEPLQDPAAQPQAPSPAVVQPDDVPAPMEEAEPTQADGQEQEPPAEQPAAPSPSADSPMTEPPPSPPPPVNRATSVVSTHTPAPPASESHNASPALVHATPTPEAEPSPPAVKTPTPKEATPAEASPPAVKSPTPKEATHAPSMPSPPTPKEATPPPVVRAPTSTPAPEVSVVADDTAPPPSEELTSVEASASVTPAAREATPTPTPREPTREPTPAIQAPSPVADASTPRPKSVTPVPKSPREATPPARELTAPAREPSAPAREPTVSVRAPTTPAREQTVSARDATASARDATTPAREPTPSVREATPIREPTPPEHGATPPAPAREPSPVVVAAPSPELPAEAMDVDSDEASEAPETPPPAAVAVTQPDASATADEASDGMSTATVEAVLDNDGMQVDDEHAEAASNATTPRQSPTTVSPSALEPPPVARAPAVTFNSALFGRPSVPKAPEPHASNAYTSPQRRVTNAAPYVAPPEPRIAFDFTPIAQPPAADAGGLLVPESDFTRALTLPPLASLPPSFNHTVKPAKLQRKREKERKEGAPPKKDGEKEFIPLGLNRWAALIRANPVHKHIKKAAKVLFTADWRLAQDELMFVRAMDRIGQLKKEQMWSFRQPKRAKQPVHIKVHWDYLLDEMKWMRTDYREERKWKVMLAHELAQACKAWVHAPPEVRRSMCARYRLRREEPGALDDEDVLMDDAEDAPPAVPPSTPPPEVPPPVEPMFVEGWQPPAYGTPDPLGPPSPERLPNYEPDTGTIATATYTHLEPAVDDAAPRPVSELIDEVAMKTEETEQQLGLGTSVEIDALDSDEGGRENTAAVILDEGAALKDAGNNPTLANTSSSSKLGPYKALRDPILSLDEDELWIDFNDLRVDDAEKDKLPADGVPLPEIFPELDVYEPLPPFDGEIAMSILDIKNHPSDKRVDETFSGKLASTSIFMDTKPTLVGALNPAQNWRNGKWVNLEDTAVHPPSGPVENKDWDHHMSELFKMHGTSATPRNSSIPKMPPNAHLRASDLPWTPADDELLKSIVDRFPNNWHLVAEWFNSSRVTINMDRRSPWDCCERWHRKFGLAATDAAANEQPRSPSPNLYESSNARTLKRLASNTVLGMNTEPRKRRRLLHLQDAVRKVSKKREQQQRAASQTKRTLNANVHETHTKIAKSSMSALELTRLKCERDSQERQRQQQANEAMRNVAAQHPAQRQMILAHQQQLGLMQRAPGQLAQLPGMPRMPGAPPAAGMPPGMAALQNIPAAQRAHFMRAQQVIHQAQQQAGVAAAAAAGSSTASPMLQSSSPQTSPPRPGAAGPGNARPGSTAPTVPLDPAAFQVAQQQALHAAMMQGYGSEEQMRQRIGIQNMLAGSSTAAPPPPQGGNHAGS